MVNGVGFVISEDLTSGSGARLDQSIAFVLQSFIEVKKGQRKLLTDIRRGMESAPLASVSKGVIYIFSYYSKSKKVSKL